MPPQREPLLQEIHRLTMENNRMLHKIRRGAVWGKIFTLVFYAALFLAPIWFYWAYLNDTVQKLLQAYNQVQGTGQQAQSQYQAIQDALKQFQAKVQSLGATSSHQ